MHVGHRVHVRGTRTGTGIITATEIELQTTNPGNPGPPVPPPTPPKDDDPKDKHDDPHQSIELSGAVSNRSGTCPTITFAVQSKTVGTSKATEFSGTTCATLANGDQVQVKATRQSDGTLLAIGVEKKKK